MSRTLQRSQSEVHEDDVSEILSDFDGRDEDQEESENPNKPVIFVTSKLKSQDTGGSSKERDEIDFEIDNEDFEDDEEEEEEDDEDEISEIQ